MREEKDDILIQRYIAGDLRDDQRRELRRRLERERPLRELLRCYRSIEDQLHDLPEPELPDGLWAKRIGPALEQKLQRGTSLWGRLSGFAERFNVFVLRPAVVVPLIAVLIVGVTLLVQIMLNTENGLTPKQQQAEQAISEIQQFRRQVLAKLEELTTIMEERKDEMSSEMVQLYDETLAKIDESIADAERFFFTDPNDRDAVELLFAVYERKGQFLTQFINMEL